MKKILLVLALCFAAFSTNALSDGDHGDDGDSSDSDGLATSSPSFPEPIPCGKKGTLERVQFIDKALEKVAERCRDYNRGYYDDKVSKVRPDASLPKCPSFMCPAIHTRVRGTTTETTFLIRVGSRTSNSRRPFYYPGGGFDHDEDFTVAGDEHGDGGHGDSHGDNDVDNRPSVEFQISLRLINTKSDELVCVNPVYSPEFTALVSAAFAMSCDDSPSPQ